MRKNSLQQKRRCQIAVRIAAINGAGEYSALSLVYVMKAFISLKRTGQVKKSFLIAMMVATLAACGSKETRVQRTTDERGTEIVLNKLEPVQASGSPSTFELAEEWHFSTSDDAVAEFGLGDFGLFTIDSKGNVYFSADQSHEKAVLKFDATGRPAASFGRRGQGPGEIHTVAALYVTGADEIAVTNQGNNRLTIYGSDGSFHKESPVSPRHLAVAPLINGSFVTVRRMADPKPGFFFEFPIDFAGPDLNVRSDLDTGFLENPMTSEKLLGTYHIQSWGVSRDKIFTGHQDRGYDIFVYDFDGRPVRKIRKKFAPVPVPEAHKKEFLDQFNSPHLKAVQERVYFPPAMPAFISFAVDETGRLYVMTYETTVNPGEFVFDVFDADGVFILRKPLRVFQDYNGAHFKVRGDRLYCVEEGEDGQKIFRVFRMTWK